jgi:SAM-dependent methyltransferase
MTMPTVDENVAQIARFYALQVPAYHDFTYGSEHVEEFYSRLKLLYQTTLAGHTVLEIACGTGYWTETIALAARSVLATDVNQELVEATRKRTARFPHVHCQVADAYSLANVSGKFSAAFAHYWWSHVPKKKQRAFLDALHAALEPGALVIFTDNLVYEWDWVKRRTDEHGDIYEQRVLPDGSIAETIKNFPSESELTSLLEGIAEDVSYVEQQPEQLWTLTYHVKR